MVDCAFNLLSLPALVSAHEFLSALEQGQFLLSGVPHGWVLEPHASEAKHLASRDWNLFLLTEASGPVVQDKARELAVPLVQGTVSIPQVQYEQLVANMGKPATPSKDTPPLPREWDDGRTGHVPSRHVHPPKTGSLAPGELKLYEPMATLLSTALPDAVRDKPVSLFNLFKYRKGDPSVHKHYMQGFKDKFGPAAGAQLKFMGPVSSQPELVGQAAGRGAEAAESAGWQDANVVQYDSIWHYAYMLSTDVYQELNKEKVRGLENTCILLISEIELRA